MELQVALSSTGACLILLQGRWRLFGRIPHFSCDFTSVPAHWLIFIFKRWVGRCWKGVLFSLFFLPFRRPLSSSRPVSVLCSLFSHITMSPQPFLTLNSDHRHDFDYDYDNSSEISTHRNISFLYSVSDPSGISTAEILKCNLDNGFLVLNAAQEVEEQDAVDARDRLGQSSTHEPLQLFLYSQDEPFSDEPEQF